MNHNLFRSARLQLTGVSPEEFGELFAKWSRDSEFLQLWEFGAAMTRNAKKAQEWFQQEQAKAEPGSYEFIIKRSEDGRSIGMTGLWDTRSPHRAAWVAIGIGERDLWGKGYGTEAMNLILGVAFLELNLHRVNLSTFSYNPRAIRSYEKVGFVHEGAARGGMRRYGERADLIYMGILRDEWLARQTPSVQGDRG